jgi:hypothetical protein
LLEDLVVHIDAVFGDADRHGGSIAN